MPKRISSPGWVAVRRQTSVDPPPRPTPPPHLLNEALVASEKKALPLLPPWSLCQWSETQPPLCGPRIEC